MEPNGPALGHVHLKVRDLERSVAFYRAVLGLEVTERVGGGFVFLSGGDAHHELALQELGPGAVRPPPHAVGLYHTAWEVPERRAFALAWRRLTALEVEAEAVDHGISWALYFRDPDGNGVEIYLDRRAEAGGTRQWRGASRPLAEHQVLADPVDTGEPPVSSPADG